MLREYFIVFYGAIVIAFLLLKGAIDMFASIEYAEGAFPRLAKLAESKKAQRLLLLATMIFYGGTLYEMLSQPPMPPICAPSPTKTSVTTLVQENSELKDRLAVLTKPRASKFPKASNHLTRRRTERILVREATTASATRSKSRL